MPSEQMSWLEPAPPCWLDSAEPLAEAAIPPLCFGWVPISAFPLANFSWAAHSCSLDLQDVSLLPDGSFYFCFPPLRSNYVSRAAAEVLKMIRAGKSTKSGARRYLASANLQQQHFFFATWYLLEIMCQVSLLCRKRAMSVPVPGPQHSWWCGQTEHRAVTWCCGRQGDCSWRIPAPPSVPAASLLTQNYTGVSTDLAASWATCFDPAWICFGLLCDSNIYFQLKRGEVKEERDMVIWRWS